MIKRPLFVAGAVFIPILCLFYSAGFPGFGKPAEETAVEKCIGSGKNVTITGQVYRRVERANSIQYDIRHADLTKDQEIKFTSGGHPAENSNETIRYNPEKIPINGGILVTTQQQEEILPGAVVRVEGKLEAVEEAGNPGQFDSVSYYGAKGIFYSMWADKPEVLREGSGWRAALERFRTTLRRNLEEMLPQPHAGTMAAMLLGDKSMLDPETKINYQMGSLLHVLSISGLHLSLLGMGLYRLLVRVRLPVPGAAGAAVVFMGIYCIFTGQNVATLRALVMFGAVLGAKVTGRSYDALSSISLSLILLLTENHFNLFYSGFQLSFAAVIGAGVIYPLWRKGFGAERTRTRADRLRKWLLDNVLSCLAITMTSMPVVSFHFGEISVLGLASNLVVLPSLAGVMVPGILGMAAGLISLKLGAAVMWLPRILLGFYETVAGGLRQIPGVSLICGRPALWQAVVYYLLLALGTWWIWRLGDLGRQGIRQRVWKITGMFLSLAAGISILLWRRPVELSVTVLDVGQGDCIVVCAGTFSMLVDGGSSDVKGVGDFRILPYLKSQGIRSLDSIVITHPDADHVSGILELMEAVADRETTLRISRLFLPVWMRGTSEEEQFLELAARTGSAVGYLQRGDAIRSGEMSARILHPDKRDYSFSPNEGSVTMEITYGSFRGLLTGDLEGEAENRLIPSLGQCQFLKVGHHGSKNGTGQSFLERVRPKTAVISCGLNNRYGHPDPGTVKRLLDMGSDCWYTMESGAVRMELEGRRMQVTGFTGCGGHEKPNSGK